MEDTLLSNQFLFRNMSTKFYIGTRRQANGRYFIHREDCPLLPSYGERISFGTFLTPNEAAEEGRKYFAYLGSYQFCLKGHYTETEDIKLVEIREKPGSMTHVGVEIT
jgi:hypothetical protein